MGRKSGQVLRLEDDPIVSKLFSTRLRRAGFEVDVEDSVSGALTAIDMNYYDILVTDAVLPDGDPSVVVRSFREKCWKPVLLCSGYMDGDELLEDLRPDEYRFLHKPFSNAILVRTVEELLSVEG